MGGQYNVGSLVRVKNNDGSGKAGDGFRDKDLVLQDPPTICLRVQEPGGAVSVYVYGTDAIVIKDSTGKYHADFSTTGKAGTWYYRWYAPPGTAQSAKDASFTVTQLFT